MCIKKKTKPRCYKTKPLSWPSFLLNKSQYLISFFLKKNIRKLIASATGNYLDENISTCAVSAGVLEENFP